MTQLSIFMERFVFLLFSAKIMPLMSNCPSAAKKASDEPKRSKFRSRPKQRLTGDLENGADR